MKLFFKYHLENFIARKSNFVYFLLVISIISALLMLGVKGVFGMNDDKPFLDQWWDSLTNIINIGSGDNFNERLVNFLYWALGVAFSGTIIAFLAAKVSNFITNLNKGKSTIIDTNHYVIIGWNANIFNIFAEIQTANLNQSKPTILCFNGLDNLEMRAMIDLEISKFKKIRVLTRSGDVYNIADLARTNAKNAKSVIILDDTVKKNFNIETTLLAVKKNIPNNNIPIVVQFSNEDNIATLSDLMSNQLYPISKNKLISNVTSQAVRNKHISTVVLDFLDYDGDEVYFFKAGVFVGLTFKQVMLNLQSEMLIGVLTNNNKVVLNPDKNYIIQNEDLLIIIAEDDENILKLHDKPYLSELLNVIAIKPRTESFEEPKSILVLGWSKLGQQIFDKTIQFLGAGSKVSFLYRKDFVTTIPNTENYSHEVSLIETNTNDQELLSNCLIANDFDIVLILGYDDYYSADVSDTYSMMKNLAVKKILETKKTSFSTRIILQLNDGSKKDLISTNQESEFIVSDLLSALLITQLADNPKLWYVFEELFSNEGLKININHSDAYDPIKKEEISVEDLLILALKKDETLIGYVENNQCYLNPNKSKIINDITKTELIVIG
jgi:Trk K+ transport system NAD-binding subunit